MTDLPKCPECGHEDVRWVCRDCQSSVIPEEPSGSLRAAEAEGARWYERYLRTIDRRVDDDAVQRAVVVLERHGWGRTDDEDRAVLREALAAALDDPEGGQR